ncbi:MAG: hypothetical protein A4S16_03390 [Proteobacteria bacterium SG_bin6]|nr:MAG: hypothetical protein A4S16_03390 [Proteobacteria bacterium SG_bin6]
MFGIYSRFMLLCDSLVTIIAPWMKANGGLSTKYLGRPIGNSTFMRRDLHQQISLILLRQGCPAVMPMLTRLSAMRRAD